MLHDEPRAQFVVVVHRVVVGLARRVQRDDHRRYARGDFGESVADARADEDEPVHAAVAHRFDQRRLGHGIRFADAEQQLVLRPFERCIDAGEDVGKERVVEVWDDEAQRIGLAAHAARRGVRAVAEPLDRSAHLGPERLADPVGIAKDFRYRGDGNAGVLRHFADGHTS